MNVLVTGASGLVGSALVPHLTRAGHRVIELKRGRVPDASGPPSAIPQGRVGAPSPTASSSNPPDQSATERRPYPSWDLQTGTVDLAPAGQIDAVIHLAGENIAQRWTPSVKTRIRDSRVRGTELICRAVADLQPRPRVLLSASAVGYYGNRGEELLTEERKPGTGFLADLCQEWEAASAPAAQAGLRVAHLRLGVVLDPNGGALKKMLPAFRAGVAGRVGSGRQYWSWITLGDTVRAIEFLLNNDTLRGPFNVVAPTPVRNSDFTKTLARVLRRPAILPVPGFALRMLLGQMADEALLASARVLPHRLQQSGFLFAENDLESALRKLLGKNTLPA
ncbi:MAG TPA: TIGR01777 family oxidoreductase [Candidatus Binatia bacterium]|nr:TIGR01777 family oxidoreductase [Candidatus Binatia bacterium]